MGTLWVERTVRLPSRKATVLVRSEALLPLPQTSILPDVASSMFMSLMRMIVKSTRCQRCLQRMTHVCPTVPHPVRAPEQGPCKISAQCFKRAEDGKSTFKIYQK